MAAGPPRTGPGLSVQKQIISHLQQHFERLISKIVVDSS